MISFCIPIYNFDVTALVSELSLQAKAANLPYEIILIDDCSNPKFKKINQERCKQETYIELTTNIGRSKIRNLFLEYTSFDYLLFLDCDSIIESPSFIANYLNVINQKPKVVCGGRIYNSQKTHRKYRLRWKYGILRESQTHTERSISPNKSFMTNNFLIHKSVFDIVKFDEQISQYGHEDTLFGLSLKNENINILHINNPITNGDIESNAEYLSKTNEGIANLVRILENSGNNSNLINNITLLSFYNKIKKYEFAIKWLFKIFRTPIYFLLSKGFVTMYLFDIYKLGLFIEYRTSAKQH